MKKSYLLILALIGIIVQSCTTDNTEEQTVTTVNLTAKTLNGEKKTNTKILMFAEMPSTLKPLPKIIKEVTTDEMGEAKFNLNNITTIPTTYYFGAFDLNTDGSYRWRSVSIYKTDLSSGANISNTIFVMQSLPINQPIQTQGKIHYSPKETDGCGWQVEINNQYYTVKNDIPAQYKDGANVNLTIHTTGNIIPCGLTAMPYDEIVIDTIWF